MAGEWIKLEMTTLDKPEVLRIARILKIDRDAALGKLVRLWSWFDANSVDGVVDGVVDADVDRMCFCPGFAAACVSVGWLVVDEVGERITLPNFDRHNGETAKKRALKNRRQANWRKSVDTPKSTKASHVVDGDASTNASTREEKRREEVKANPLTPADAGAKVGRKKSDRMAFATFVQTCRDQGEKPIKADDPIFTFADDARIPHDFIALAWRAFVAKHRTGRKQQAGIVGWRAHFRDAVRGNWAKLWYFPNDGEEAALTTVGIALRREAEAAANRRQAPQDDAGAAA